LSGKTGKMFRRTGMIKWTPLLALINESSQGTVVMPSRPIKEVFIAKTVLERGSGFSQMFSNILSKCSESSA